MIILKKQKDKDFKILNVSDFNFWCTDVVEGAFPIKLVKYTIEKLIEKTNPDLITFTGDFAFAKFSNDYEVVGKMLDSFNIPWAFIMGNHDDQFGLDVANNLADILLKNKHCLFEKGDYNLGCGNYVIRIDEENKPIYALIMMDTHDRTVYVDENGNETPCYDTLSPAQLDWYKKTVLSLGLKNTLFIHIPFYTYKTAFDEAFNSQYDKLKVPVEDSANEKYWNDGYKGSSGVCFESICSYPTDCGEFEAIKETKLTEMVIAGHDHKNNFIIPYQGVRLCFALKTGDGTYWDERLNGGSLITINKNGATIEHIYIKPIKEE